MSLVKVALLNLSRRKSRTLLSLVGIIIGICALTLLIAVVDGLYDDAIGVVSKMDGIMVYEESAFDPVISNIPISYEFKLKNISGVKKVIPEVYEFLLKIDGKKPDDAFGGAGNYVYGVPPLDLKKGSFGAMIDSIIKGRALKNTDRKSVMIPKTIADDFRKNVGDKIDIDGTKYTVIGIFEMSYSMSGNPIIMPIEEVYDLYGGDRGFVNDYYVIPTSSNNSDNIAKLIEFKYDELIAQDSQALSEQLGDFLGQIKLLAIIVSLIAGIVAAIGVINTMLMSVMERTKEIGTLKAVGWTPQNILIVIVLESLFIGVIGSILGIILGVVFSILIESFGINTSITIALVLQNFLFGTIIGIIGGIYPAYIASKMDPVEALRGN